MSNRKNFFSNRRRYHPLSLPRDFSDEEMARDWTISEADKQEIGKHRKDSRLFIAVQMCTIRLYGRFLGELNDVSPRIINYLNRQLQLPPSLTVQFPDRKATYIEQRKKIMIYLGFHKFDEESQKKLKNWLHRYALQGELPAKLYHRAEAYLLSDKIILPGPSVLERLVVNVCATAHEKSFELLYSRLTPELRASINQLLSVPEGEQRSLFHKLKEYPPSAKISSLRRYLERYRTLERTGVSDFEETLIDPAFMDYLFRMTKNYSSKHLKRFKEHKRYSMMICFMLESRKVLLDYLVKMHDQYIMGILTQRPKRYILKTTLPIFLCLNS